MLETAAVSGVAATVKKLITAGAVGLDRALVRAVAKGNQRNYAPLLRAGAAIPPSSSTFCEKIRAAGGYKAYERAHRQRLVGIFAPKFPHLPADMLGRVLEFVFDVGGH